ncbi:hypothetical protein DSUL_60057 [Desulfovibrionales bacterium]
MTETGRRGEKGRVEGLLCGAACSVFNGRDLLFRVYDKKNCSMLIYHKFRLLSVYRIANGTVKAAIILALFDYNSIFRHCVSGSNTCNVCRSFVLMGRHCPFTYGRITDYLSDLVRTLYLCG